MAPMLLALVLGDMAESALRQGLIMSQGSLLIFLRPPITLPLRHRGSRDRILAADPGH